MDNICKKILLKVGIHFNNLEELNNMLIVRELLLDNNKYEDLREDIHNLKKVFSSSYLTSLHKNAEINQRFPLLNLVRQILHVYLFRMEPIRKSNGYTVDGKKKFKRFFIIKKHIINNDIKMIINN